MLKIIRSNWIALASSFLLLAAIFYILHKEENFRGLIEVWQRTDPVALAFAVLLMMFVLAASAWRVEAIMTADGIETARFLPVLRIQFISQLLAHGTPISAFADVARAAMIKLRFATRLGQSIRIIFYERVCGALGSVIFGLVAVLIQLTMSLSHTLVKVQLLLWGGGVIGVIVLLVIGDMHVTTGIDIFDRGVRAIVALGQMLRKPVVALKLALASLAQLLLFAAVFLVLAYGLQLNVPVWSTVLFMPLIYFVSSLPIFYQGWGGREAIVIATIGSAGTITSAEAIALSISFGVIVFIASLPGAVFWLMRPSMRKAIRQEVDQP